MSQSSSDSTVDLELELDDIQYGAVHQRPSPYVATYLLVRIDDRQGGRELLRRLRPLVDAARPSLDAARDTSVTVALTYQGLLALGVPSASLDSFAPEFRQGMATRAEVLGDVGESSPAAWEKPLGSPDVHVAVAVLSPDAEGLEASLARACNSYQELRGVELIWRQDCYQLPTGRTSFGFKDGIGQPAIEGGGVPGTNPLESPIKAGEFILGYPDETGALPAQPSPEILGRNGTYIAFRKLHTRVAAYRQYLRANAASRQQEALLGAKMVGRWQSGAPLAVSPDGDDPELGSDPNRNNRFRYTDDLGGFKCPAGAHARRANPRDALDGDGSVNVRLHRMIRRGTSYGPPLPEGVLEDDGADRGIVFVFAGTHLDRQFEFVKTQWLNDGVFIGAPGERDPLVGSGGGSGQFTIPQRPIRRRLQGMPPFVVTRGGEYCFVPGLRALNWLAGLET
jgi:Dyp-type peroxidase family